MDKINMSQEYSDRFDKLRRNRVEISFYKYGPVRKNFATGNVQAIPTMERCVKNIKKLGTQNIYLTRQTTLCSSSCTHSTLKRISEPQTVVRVLGLLA